MPGSRLSVKSGRGVAAPGGVELPEPNCSCPSSSPVALCSVATSLADAIVRFARSEKERVEWRSGRIEGVGNSVRVTIGCKAI